jgi:YD repeat-containing protein
MISRTDALGNTAYWKYNTGKSDPDLFINEEGEKTRYQYNESGKLCSICYEDGKRADYYYNKLGQQTKVSDWTGDFETDFDCYGRLTSVTDAYQSKLTYAMDPAGRTQKMIYPDKREYKYDYDIRGNLSEIKTTGFSVSYQYDDYGRVNEKSMLIDFRKGENADPHSITEQYSYSDSGKLMKLIQRSGSNPVAEYNFRYDSLGNVLSRKTTEWDDEKSKTEILDYTYDSMNRLTRVTDTSAPDRIETREKYEYDSFGNCIHSLREGVMTENHYNVLDQLVSSRIKDNRLSES